MRFYTLGTIQAQHQSFDATPWIFIHPLSKPTYVMDFDADNLPKEVRQYGTLLKSWFILMHFNYFRTFFASGPLELSEEQLKHLVNKYSLGQAFILRMVGKSCQYYLYKNFIISNAKATTVQDPNKKSNREKRDVEKGKPSI